MRKKKQPKRCIPSDQPDFFFVNPPLNGLTGKSKPETINVQNVQENMWGKNPGNLLPPIH